jgi:hypothetical protein
VTADFTQARDSVTPNRGVSRVTRREKGARDSVTGQVSREVSRGRKRSNIKRLVEKCAWRGTGVAWASVTRFSRSAKRGVFGQVSRAVTGATEGIRRGIGQGENLFPFHARACAREEGDEAFAKAGSSC